MEEIFIFVLYKQSHKSGRNSERSVLECMDVAMTMDVFHFGYNCLERVKILKNFRVTIRNRKGTRIIH